MQLLHVCVVECAAGSCYAAGEHNEDWHASATCTCTTASAFKAAKVFVLQFWWIVHLWLHEHHSVDLLFACDHAISEAALRYHSRLVLCLAQCMAAWWLAAAASTTALCIYALRLILMLCIVCVLWADVSLLCSLVVRNMGYCLVLVLAGALQTASDEHCSLRLTVGQPGVLSHVGMALGCRCHLFCRAGHVCM
jgi:hypothetical protein